MAGKKRKQTERRGSILRDALFRGDPQELRLQPNESITLVPLHGVEEGIESFVHAVSYQYRGRWDQATCALDTNGECPFCEDPRQEVSRVVPRSFMLVYLPKSEEVKYLKLPIGVARTLLKWEDGANEDPEDKTITVRGRRVVFSRTGSGRGTKYDVSIYNDVSNKIDPSSFADQTEKVAERATELSTPKTSDELRDVLNNAYLQLRDREDEEDTQGQDTTVEEEEW